MPSMQTASAISTTAVAHPWLDFNDAQIDELRSDKDDVRTRLLDQLESALTYLLPHGKRRGTQFLVGNVRGDPGDSLAVDLEGDKRGL